MRNESVCKGVFGSGTVSTAFYLKEIHKKYQQINHKLSTYPFLMYQIDFQELNPFLPNQFEVLIPKLKAYLKEITSLGITKLLVPNITLHETLDQMVLPLEIFHPVDLTLKYLKENCISEVTLFGTLYTMNSDYLKSKFKKEGISLLKPTEIDQKWIDEFRKNIYDENESSLETATFQNLIKKYSIGNQVVIACTELSLFAAQNCPSCIDMASLQIEEFLK